MRPEQLNNDDQLIICQSVGGTERASLLLESVIC